MTDDQLAAQLHELKRRNQAPIALIEMLDALLALDLCLSAKQKRKKFTRSWLGHCSGSNARTPDR